MRSPELPLLDPDQQNRLTRRKWLITLVAAIFGGRFANVLMEEMEKKTPHQKLLALIKSLAPNDAKGFRATHPDGATDDHPHRPLYGFADPGASAMHDPEEQFLRDCQLFSTIVAARDEGIIREVTFSDLPSNMVHIEGAEQHFPKAPFDVSSVWTQDDFRKLRAPDELKGRILTLPELVAVYCPGVTVKGAAEPMDASTRTRLRALKEEYLKLSVPYEILHNAYVTAAQGNRHPVCRLRDGPMLSIGDENFPNPRECLDTAEQWYRLWRELYGINQRQAHHLLETVDGILIANASDLSQMEAIAGERGRSLFLSNSPFLDPTKLVPVPPQQRDNQAQAFLTELRRLNIPAAIPAPKKPAKRPDAPPQDPLKPERAVPSGSIG